MDTPSAIAANLRRTRSARGLSLSDLARRAGLAKATLVGLEGGRGNPTIGTLRALADELGVSLEQLVSEDAAPTLLVGRAGDGTVIRGDGADVRFIHRSAAGGAMLELYALVVHAPHESSAHPAGVLEQIVVADGALRVTVGGAATDLERGDFMAFSADRPHRYEPLGAGPARGTMLMTYPEVPGPIWTVAAAAGRPATGGG